ncbi:lipoprotein [Spirochaetia bacterium]|nr:lipoprotein [Spirochaetia bacterium]
MGRKVFSRLVLILLAGSGVLLGGCTRVLGWGMLLWSTREPAIPSGTVLPVYIKSNIDQVWVVGIPEVYRQVGDEFNKFEIPLSQLELVGSKRAARARAADFGEYALLYAETLQDGLPIREDPDNSSRRVYRLRTGQIIKVLEKVEGIPAISTTGDPLPGDWYRVLTEDGSRGYCFSYRLNLFEHRGGTLDAASTVVEETEDPELEAVLAQTWYPESWDAMIASGRIDTAELAHHWGFFPGQDSGLARIYLPNLDRTFTYTQIRPDGSQTWRFDGGTLKMTLRSDRLLAVQFAENGGAMQTHLFVTLPSDLDDIIIQETERREALFQNIFQAGPAFTSTNYGDLIFTQDRRFVWTGNSLLIPQIIPASALDSGSVDMGLFLSAALAGRYDGAFILNFDGAGEPRATARFCYTLDDQGLRIEYVSEDALDGITVRRRDSSPTVIYFFKTEQ